jgi:hypothetical protein
MLALNSFQSSDDDCDEIKLKARSCTCMNYGNIYTGCPGKSAHILNVFA